MPNPGHSQALPTLLQPPRDGSSLAQRTSATPPWSSAALPRPPWPSFSPELIPATEGPPPQRDIQPHPGLPGSGDLTGFCAEPANTRDTAASIFLMERSRLTRRPRHPGTQKEWCGRPQVSLRRPEPKPRPKRSDGVATASHAALVCRPTRMVAGDGYALLRRNMWPSIN